jgi:hypothetical protein
MILSLHCMHAQCQIHALLIWVQGAASKHRGSKGKSKDLFGGADDEENAGSSGDEEEEEESSDEEGQETKFEKKAKKRSQEDARDRKLADAEAEAMLQTNVADVRSFSQQQKCSSNHLESRDTGSHVFTC